MRHTLIRLYFIFQIDNYFFVPFFLLIYPILFGLPFYDLDTHKKKYEKTIICVSLIFCLLSIYISADGTEDKKKCADEK